MRLSQSDKRVLLFALNLAIRDRETAIDKDNPNEELDKDAQYWVDKFTALRDRLAKEIKGAGGGD